MAVATSTGAREAIIEAVDRLLGEIGYRRMTVEDIARAAGLSRRTVYLYFAGKEEATLACLDGNIARLVAESRRLAESSGTPRSRLAEILRFRVRFLHETARHRQAMNDEIYGELRPLYMPRREKYLADEAAVLVQVLTEGQASGAFAFDDAQETALMLLLATNAFMPFGLSAGQLRRRAELDRRVTAMAELLLRGLDADKKLSKKEGKSS